jgi:hypothetical protein
MGAGYARAPEVVTSYAKPTPSAGERKDIQHIPHPPYRDAVVVLEAASQESYLCIEEASVDELVVNSRGAGDRRIEVY